MVATLVTAGAEQASSRPIHPLGLAILAMAVFGLLLLVVFAFRSVSHKH
jgi:hypothetical protein